MARVDDRAAPRQADLRNVALAILAGGEGSRMGYAKAEMRLHGRPILRVLLERFAWPGPTLLVTAPGRERPTGHEAFTSEVVDPSPGQGPLRGLVTALENSPVPWLVVTAVDMPLVRREQLVWLASEVQQGERRRGLMLYEVEGDRRELQPLPAAFQIDTAIFGRQLLGAGRRSLQSLLSDASISGIDAPVSWPRESWTNINTSRDLELCAAIELRRDS